MFGKAPYVLRYVPTFCIDYIEIPAPTIQLAEVRYTYRIPKGIAENAGYGINKLASWETLTGARPIIESNHIIATVSLPFKSAIQKKAEESNVGKILNNRQQQILDLVTNNPTISLTEMAKIIGVTIRTIEREIPKMGHIIHHRGPKNGGYWEILD